MIDIHCHILPGIDDGPETIDVALQMAQSAIADGITHVIATPHASDDFCFDPRRVRALRDELQALIGPGLELGIGCDFRLNAENLEALKSDPQRFTLCQRNYLLVEFNEFAIPPSAGQTLHELQLAGLQPIITHPERNAILRGQPERLARWVKLGCAAQVTASVLTGSFGPAARQFAQRWIGQGLVHFVASDAHNLRGRPLRLRPAYDAVRERFGEEVARALFLENPRAAWEGRPLPYVPEVADEATRPRRKRFLFF
ncbi:MAG: CpsB/CapC family capsule biosynthesis tyrosine phosphatase [Candidatus Acidiferrales bacterium]|jgi:protein-tyrosine phosphatase